MDIYSAYAACLEERWSILTQIDRKCTEGQSRSQCRMSRQPFLLFFQVFQIFHLLLQSVILHLPLFFFHLLLLYCQFPNLTSRALLASCRCFSSLSASDFVMATFTFCLLLLLQFSSLLLKCPFVLFHLISQLLLQGSSGLNGVLPLGLLCMIAVGAWLLVSAIGLANNVTDENVLVNVFVFSLV